MRYTDSHIIGYASNNPNELATAALTIEIVCHFGGPRFILSITPVAKLKSFQIKDLLQEAIRILREKGGCPVALICDNCPTNQGVYSLLGGPGVVLLSDGLSIYLIYDYPHIFKNLRNNWITEAQKQLIFMVDGKEYLPCWSDIVNLYEEDRKEPIRLTKLTHTSVYPKPLQRQNVPLVYQVFNEKTYAAFLALTTKLKPQQGTAIFLKMISDWLKMMSVKDK